MKMSIKILFRSLVAKILIIVLFQKIILNMEFQFFLNVCLYFLFQMLK
jgi:hypothetical protein